MSTPTARQRRLYRARAAAHLATLDTSCSVEELLTIDWSALESLPHWCFISAEQSRVLQLLCGAVFYAPMIQQLIDGQRIQTLCELIGQQGYQGVLAYSATSIDSNDAMPDFDSGELEAMLLQAGNSVKRSAIQHPVIARLVMPVEDDIEPLATEIAVPIYAHALGLFDTLFPTKSPDEQSSAHINAAVVNAEMAATHENAAPPTPQESGG